jgi:hypothetical protein
LAGNLVKPLLSLYGTEWRERGYGLNVNILVREETHHAVDQGVGETLEQRTSVEETNIQGTNC